MSKEMVTLEAAQSAVRVAAANALATAFVTGIDAAREEGRPLLQVQEIALWKMAVMAYGDVLDVAKGLEVDAAIHRHQEASRRAQG